MTQELWRRGLRKKTLDAITKRYEQNFGKWKDYTISALSSLQSGVNYQSVNEETFRIYSDGSSRTALLRFIYEEHVCSDLSEGLTVRRIEDMGIFDDLLQATDELIGMSVSYVTGNYETGRGRKLGFLEVRWIDLPFVSYEGKQCIERVYKKETMMEKLFMSESTTICPEEVIH